MPQCERSAAFSAGRDAQRATSHIAAGRDVDGLLLTVLGEIPPAWRRASCNGLRCQGQQRGACPLRNRIAGVIAALLSASANRSRLLAANLPQRLAVAGRQRLGHVCVSRHVGIVSATH